MQRGRLRWVLGPVIAAGMGCGPALVLEDGTDASSGGAPTSTGTPTNGVTTEPTPGTTAIPPDTTTAGLDESTAASTLEEGGVVIPGIDSGIPPECDLFEQDCPVGDKCVPWSGDGSPEWNVTRCVPVLGGGEADDPCTAPNGPYGGFDDCGFGLMCWNVDPETSEGICIPLCGDFGGNPGCNDPDRICFTSGEVLAVCAYSCDPLLVDCAGVDEGCYPVTDGAVCLPDESGDMGAPGDPCEAINSCDIGSACVDATAVPGCPEASCCTAVCDLFDPGTWSCLPGQTCEPWDELDPWGESGLGICIAPP